MIEKSGIGANDWVLQQFYMISQIIFVMLVSIFVKYAQIMSEKSVWWDEDSLLMFDCESIMQEIVSLINIVLIIIDWWYTISIGRIIAHFISVISIIVIYIGIDLNTANIIIWATCWCKKVSTSSIFIVVFI